MPPVSDHEPDQAVMRRVQLGETEAFAELIRRYQLALLRVARSRLGSPAAAEDVVQETFLAAFKSRHTYNEQFGFRTWLWTILLNQCRRHAGRESRKPRVESWSDHEFAAESQTVDPAADKPDPLASLLSKERTATLETLLNRLPDNQADALRLRFFGELKFDEIAAAMQCTPGTAKNRVKAGLLRLAELLKESERPAAVARAANPGETT